MIEEQLRDSFARHEAQAPDVETLRRGIVRLGATRRRRRIALRSGGAAAIVAVVLLAIPVIVRTLPPGGLPTIAPGLTTNLPDGPLNFLVLGLEPTDPAGGHQPSSDSVTLVHLSGNHKRVYLVDVERDVLVDIPGHGQGKINSAYALGGAQLTAQVVRNLTGVTLDGTAVVTLDALRDLTAAVGPIRVCLPDTVVSIHTGRTFPPGCQWVDGTGVEDLVRQRMSLPLGGYARDANIQRVMMGLATRVQALNLLTDANRVAGLMHVGGLQLDLGSIDGIALAAQLKNLDGDSLVGIVSPHPQSIAQAGYAYERLDPIVSPQLFAALRNDTLDQFAAAHPDWLVTH